jgi:hypothetical protein
MKKFLFLLLGAGLFACAPAGNGKHVRLAVECTTCNYDVSMQGNGWVEHKTGTLTGVTHVDFERYVSNDQCIALNSVSTGETDSLKFWFIELYNQDTLVEFLGIQSGGGGGYCFQ